MDLDGATKGARETAAPRCALGAVAIADVRAAPGTALRGVRFDHVAGKDDTQQVGLRRPLAAADAAPLRDAYEVPPRPAWPAETTLSVGWLASAWWESRPQ